MVIVAGHFRVRSEERDAWVAAHRDLLRQARSEPGCVDLAITADPLDSGRVNLFELWESEAHLAAWRAIADPPPKPPILSSTVLKHRVSTSGPPFDPPRA
jgi:heme-degrading monooxygenase HmoA